MTKPTLHKKDDDDDDDDNRELQRIETAKIHHEALLLLGGEFSPGVSARAIFFWRAAGYEFGECKRQPTVGVARRFLKAVRTYANTAKHKTEIVDIKTAREHGSSCNHGHSHGHKEA